MKSSTQILKQLQTRKDGVKAELGALDKEINALSQKKKVLSRQLSGINKEIKGLTEKTKDVVISEHAILQYLRRVKGLNIDAIKAEIVPEKAKRIIDTIESAHVPVDGFKLIVKNKVVVTVED